MLSMLLFASASASPFHGCTTTTAKRLPYCNTTLSHAARAAWLVNELSLSEKIALLSPTRKPFCDCHSAAIPRLGLPAYRWLTEVNSVVSVPCASPTRCATSFVGPQNMAASFNRSSWFAKGDVVSTELRAFSNAWSGDPYDPAAVGLTGFGPNINLVKDPRYGRNSELPGEDPHLSAEYATAYVRGMQQSRPGPNGEAIYRSRAYLKHYTAYSVETNRFTFSANVSKFDLFDSNLPQFRAALQDGGASGAMCSYFAPNGVSSCGSKYLLEELMRRTWGRHDAVVMSDCSAVANMMKNSMGLNATEASAQAANAGLDVYGGWNDNLWGEGELQQAVASGLTTEAVVSAAVGRTLRHKLSLGLFDPLDSSSSPWAHLGLSDINTTHARAVAFEAALQGVVLLRNDAHALPLGTGSRVAVLGPLGNDSSLLISDYNVAGGVANGPSIFEALASVNEGGTTAFARGVDLDSGDASGVDAARKLAASSDCIVLCIGIAKAQERETHDRRDTSLPGLQETFALQVIDSAPLGAPVVIVLCNGGIVSIEALLEHAAATGRRLALVEAFNPGGQQGTRALASQLFGVTNRWGKLPSTIYPAGYAQTRRIEDMSFVNRSYRYYTGEPTFWFGDGLSLTSFEHSGCACSPAATVATDARATASITCSCALRNTGKREGDEVLMVFHSVGDAIRTQIGAAFPVPRRRLVDFTRVSLGAGEATALHFSIPLASLAITDASGAAASYPGQHWLIFSRGSAREARVPFTLK
jgi:beta-D-xylosidase 4